MGKVSQGEAAAIGETLREELPECSRKTEVHVQSREWREVAGDDGQKGAGGGDEEPCRTL